MKLSHLAQYLHSQIGTKIILVENIEDTDFVAFREDDNISIYQIDHDSLSLFLEFEFTLTTDSHAVAVAREHIIVEIHEGEI